MKPIDIIKFVGLPLEMLSSVALDDIDKVTVAVWYNQDIFLTVYCRPDRPDSELKFYKRRDSGWVTQ